MGLEIDFETADRIAVLVLKDHLKYLKEEVRANDEDGSYMHPEDYQLSVTKYIPALETLIKYFGGGSV